jgi:hypothetical protein
MWTQNTSSLGASAVTLQQDWVTGLEGGTVICEDVTIRLSTSLPILEGCLNVTCVQCENGKSISPIDSAQPTMAHGADTESDLARPPDGKHPSTRNATPAMLHRSATRRRTAGHHLLWRTRVPVTRIEATMERWMGAAQTTRGSRRNGPAEERAQPAEGRSRRTGGGSGLTMSIRSTGGALTYRMTAELLRVRADIHDCMCVLRMHMYRYWYIRTARKWD